MDAMRSAVAAVNTALAGLDAVEALGAVVDRNDGDVLERAAAVDRAGLPWLGRPITVKDWIDVEGFACEGVSPRRTGRRPVRDATAVGRLREVGAVVTAKSQPGATHPVHGTCLHPLDPSRTPGGSSSGEAVLVAAGASSLGLGSDSGGSIRLPAAWCGVYGLKPSFGRVPNTGHVPRVGGRSDGRTVIGPIAGDVASLSRALAVIAGPDGLDPSVVPVELGDPSTIAIGDLRVAVGALGDADGVARSTARAVEQAAGSLAALGATVVDEPASIDLPRAMEITVGYWQRSSRTGEQAKTQLQEWDRYDQWIARSTAEVDVILTPVVADVAPPRRELTGDDYAFTVPWSLTGWPAASVPAGADADTGMPLAVQVVAHRWADHIVLAVAAALEARKPEALL